MRRCSDGNEGSRNASKRPEQQAPTSREAPSVASRGATDSPRGQAAKGLPPTEEVAAPDEHAPSNSAAPACFTTKQFMCHRPRVAVLVQHPRLDPVAPTIDAILRNRTRDSEDGGVNGV